MSEPMPEVPMNPAVGTLSPIFIWTELSRRVDLVTAKVERLDEHGTRGVDQLRDQITRLAKDIGDHERGHERAADEQRISRRWTVGITLGAVTPLYPLLLWVLSRGRLG